jgi:hypothetical protein
MLYTAVFACKQHLRQVQHIHQQRVEDFSSLCAATVHTGNNVCAVSHSDNVYTR